MNMKGLITALAGGAAAIAAGYFIYRKTVRMEANDATVRTETSPSKRKSVRSISRAEVIEILKKNLQIENDQREKSKALRERVRSGGSLRLAYEDAKAVVADIPKDMLSPLDFEEIAFAYHGDEEVCALMSQLLQTANIENRSAANITVEQIINIHREMLNCIKECSSSVAAIKMEGDYQPIALSLGLQCYITVQCEIRMNFVSDDLDSSVLYFQAELMASSEFEALTEQIQTALNEILLP